jgi:hypothetical protein
VGANTSTKIAPSNFAALGPLAVEDNENGKHHTALGLHQGESHAAPDTDFTTYSTSNTTVPGKEKKKTKVGLVLHFFYLCNTFVTLCNTF